MRPGVAAACIPCIAAEARKGVRGGGAMAFTYDSVFWPRGRGTYPSSRTNLERQSHVEKNQGVFGSSVI
jgi:hypothetical protein